MSVISMGELLIDFVALESGVSVGDASGFQKAPGGAPANVAVAVARLGYESAFLTMVGDDPFGHFLRDILDAEGVDVRGLRMNKDARTMLAFVSLGADGERSFVFYRHPSADMQMTPDDIATEVIDTGRIFHFGSITMISEPAKSATLKAVQYAREKGLTISYDPNLRRDLWPSDEAAKAGLLAGLDYAHIVKVSDEELVYLTGADDPAALWRDDLRVIVVTHGSNGSTAYTRDGKVTVGGFSVEPVDTTGAGDGFVAGLLTGILAHPDDYTAKLGDILKRANAVGALTTTNRGAIPALPTSDQVDMFLEMQA